MLDRSALSPDRLGEYAPDWFPLDPAATLRATLITVAVLGLFVALQGSVAALFTGGHQPMSVVQEVPTEPSAQAWEEAPTRTVELNKQQMALPYGGGSTDELTVQALTNDSHVSFRLTWKDPTNDTSLKSPTAYSDAAAIMLKGGNMPPITMGAVGKPVNIWYWRGSWQYGTNKSEWTGDMYAYPHNDTLTQPGLQAGNALSQSTFERFAQNYYAKGFGSLSVAPKQNLHATGRRTENGWQVTFVRERSTSGVYDAAFTEHDQMYLAFAVWNGSAEEVNGQKSITLQYSTMNTKSGTLSAAQTGGDGGNSAGSDGGGASTGSTSGTDTGGGGGSAGDLSLSGWMLVLVTVALFTWLAAYWRVRP